MFGPRPDDYGYLPRFYETIRDNPIEIVEGDFDICGDGAVGLIFTPGHTLGHSSRFWRYSITSRMV